MTYGYRRGVLFPVRITPPKTIGADSVTVAGSIDWLECKDVCLAGSAALRLSLPVSEKAAASGRDVASLAAARARVPRSPSGWSFSAEAGQRAIALAFEPPAEIVPRGAYFFVDQPLVAEHAAPQGFERIDTGYRVTISSAPNASRNLARLTGVLVVEEGGLSKRRTAVQVDVPVSQGSPAPAPVAPEPGGLPVATSAAFVIGGLAVALLVRRMARRKPNRS
jgi:DsbC/DsbD-like thiol-disulfide interchange protein